jgi:hypothetical protein
MGIDKIVGLGQMCRCQKCVWPRAEGCEFWDAGLVRAGICVVLVLCFAARLCVGMFL